MAGTEHGSGHRLLHHVARRYPFLRVRRLDSLERHRQGLLVRIDSLLLSAYVFVAQAAAVSGAERIEFRPFDVLQLQRKGVFRLALVHTDPRKDAPQRVLALVDSGLQQLDQLVFRLALFVHSISEANELLARDA